MSSDQNYLKSLNPEQREAVENLNGPILVLAGAGSGKTRVVTFRIVHLLNSGVPTNKILGVTFTNKAANEMKERVRKLIHKDVLICTFHSLGARILRESIHNLGYQRDFVIYDEDDSEKLIKTCLESFQDGDQKIDLKSIRQAISKIKNSLIPPDSAQQNLDPQLSGILPKVYQSYQEHLRQYNAVDYDDLLFLPLKLMRDFPGVREYYQQRWSHVLIDEYQDTNPVQYELMNILVGKHHNLCIVGDPDQSIYSWRGANIQNILNFKNDYPEAKIVRLTQNYRSHTNILEAANAVISNNKNRYEKELWSDLGSGESIKHFRADDDRAEAQFIADQILAHHNNGIPFNEIAIFYRTNSQSRIFEDYFLNRRIPYVIIGGLSFYQRREIKDILAWLRMVHTGSDYLSFERTINLPKRGFGPSTVEKIRIAAMNAQHTIFSFCEMIISGQNSDVKLSAKQRQGLEEYVKIIHELRTLSKTHILSELIKSLIELTRYQDYLQEDPETWKDRAENLNALVNKAAEWEEGLAEAVMEPFLEELSLKSNLDEMEHSREHVSLMTIHNSKGLEFRVVFLAGMEEDLFPHINSKDDENALEEERRLCYVGMTRAREFLYVTEVTARMIWGVKRSQRPSRFLYEIPSKYLERIRRPTMATPAAYRYEPTPKPKKPAASKEMPISQDLFTVGDVVFHKDFGIGHIRNVADSSAGLAYHIFFTKDNSERTLVARYTQLTKL